MSSIKKYFEIILNGGKEESRVAARQVRKTLYSSRSDRGSFSDIKNITNSAVEEYYKIKEDWHQENFVIAISVIHFLRDKNNLPDLLLPWFIELLQHRNGYVRHAAVKMIIGELGPLTVHIRFPGDKNFSKERFTPEKADEILYILFISLSNLSIALHLPKYSKYKYIDSLPPSPYKSVQMVLAEMEDMCGAEYLNDFNRNYLK
jgi:hypothetical protein